MLIESSARSAAALNRPHATAGNRLDSSTSFGSSLSKTEEAKEGGQSSSSRSTTQELLAKLNEYIEKGPIVAMREKILKSMGISEAELKSLPPEKQDAIEAEIAEKIKEMLTRQQETAKVQETPSAKTRLYATLDAL